MGKPILLSGQVSHVNYMSNTSGSIYRGEGRIRTRHRVMFRVNNVPVTFPGNPSLGEGDLVELAYMSGGMGAAILRNDSTGVTYFHGGKIACYQLMGGGLVFFGLTSFSRNLVFAFVFAGMGVWILITMNKKKQTLEQLISKNS